MYPIHLSNGQACKAYIKVQRDGIVESEFSQGDSGLFFTSNVLAGKTYPPAHIFKKFFFTFAQKNNLIF